MKFRMFGGIAVILFMLPTAAVAEGDISTDDPVYEAYQKLAKLTFKNTKGDARCGFSPIDEKPGYVVAFCDLDDDDKICAWSKGRDRCFKGPAHGRVTAYRIEGSGMQMLWRFEATEGSKVFEFDDFAIGLFVD